MSPELLALITKGLDIIVSVAENTDLVTRAANALMGLLKKGDPTQAEIDAAEADLDAMLDEFNSEMPSE
jgi:hypothetical protein